MAKQPENQAILDLFQKRPEQIKPGLERIRAAWLHLGMQAYPQNYFLIAGTNGKGSTAGMLWHLLLSQGVRVGLFSSPHLCSFRERFQYSHGSVDDALLCSQLDAIQQALPADLYASLSFFEVSTLLGLKIFAELGCEAVVLEVGLGGRWDSTAVVQPLVTAITSIDRDHERWLGSTLSAIATEKLGICRSGVPLFWGERFTAAKDLEELLAQSQAEKSFPLLRFPSHFRTLSPSSMAIQLAPEQPATLWDFPDWVKEAHPVLQHNFSLAFALYSWYGEYLKSGCLKLEEEKSGCLKLEHSPAPALAWKPAEVLQRFGAEDLPWPNTLHGRFQRLALSCSQSLGHDHPQSLLLDVCHNPASAQEFVHTLKTKGLAAPARPLPAFVAILNDKDVSGILDTLRPVLSPLLLFQVPSERSFTRDALAARHQDLLMFARFSLAWEYAKEHWSSEPDARMPWGVCGSFLAVGEVIDYFSAFSQQHIVAKTLRGCCPSALAGALPCQPAGGGR